MANIVTLSGPSPTQEIVSHFIDQFGQDRRFQQQQDLERQQLAQTGRYQQGELGVQQGLLKNAQDKFNQLREEYDNQQINAEAAPVLAKLQQMFVAADSAPDPARKAAIEAEAKQFIANQSPRIQGKIKYETVRPFMTPERQGSLDTAQYGANVARSVLPTDQGGQGNVDPNAVNIVTHGVTGAFMPAEGFKHQEAIHLGQTDQSPSGVTPDLSKKIPTPSGSAVSDTEARDIGAMPSSTSDLASQTQLTEEAMRQKGEAEREKYRLGQTGAQAGERDIKQTVSGKKYADVSVYGGKEKNQLVQHYRDMNVPVLDRKDVDAIREVDNARMNQDLIKSQIISKLPKDATGRLLGGALENKLSQFFQTDEFLASSGALRAAAIQALRATAGAKGLRINQAEIAMAVDNDIPRITDTVQTALQKMKVVQGMLDSAENATLGTFTGSLLGQQQGAPSPGESWAKKFMGKASPP